MESRAGADLRFLRSAISRRDALPASTVQHIFITVCRSTNSARTDGNKAGSHSQRISDCGLFSRVHPQFEAPHGSQRLTFLQRRTRGQESADRGYPLPGIPRAGADLRFLRSAISRRDALPASTVQHIFIAVCRSTNSAWTDGNKP